MKRFHVHLAVDDLATSIAFYQQLFQAAPTVQHADYAKWMLEDPRVNFAISARGAAPGLDHLGFQVDSEPELDALQAQLAAADMSMVSEPGTACCYAESNKHWVTDPNGIAWECYHTLGAIPTFNRGAAEGGRNAGCAPKAEKPRVKLSELGVCKPGSGCC